MKKLFFYSFWYLLTTTAVISVQAEYILTFFFESFDKSKQDTQKLLKKKSVLDTLSRTAITNFFKAPIETGIPVTYGGYWTVSNKRGQVTFLREQSKPLLYVLITDKIEPIIYHGETVNHWQVVKRPDVGFYKIERQQEPATHRFFWQVTKAEFPKNEEEPLPTITIFANPDTIIAPVGITPTPDTPHFFLPSFIVKKRSSVKYVARFLKVNPYFERVTKVYKEGSDRYASLVER